jgi:hypothetical protein
MPPVKKAIAVPKVSKSVGLRFAITGVGSVSLVYSKGQGNKNLKFLKCMNWNTGSGSKIIEYPESDEPQTVENHPVRIGYPDKSYGEMDSAM